MDCKRGCFGKALPVAICRRRAGGVIEWHGAWPSQAKRFGRVSFTVIVILCCCGEDGGLKQLKTLVSDNEQLRLPVRPSLSWCLAVAKVVF